MNYKDRAININNLTQQSTKASDTLCMEMLLYLLGFSMYLFYFSYSERTAHENVHHIHVSKNTLRRKKKIKINSNEIET